MALTDEDKKRLSKQDQDRILTATAKWEAANAAGDEAGKKAAADEATRIRASAGYYTDSYGIYQGNLQQGQNKSNGQIISTSEQEAMDRAFNEGFYGTDIPGDEMLKPFSMNQTPNRTEKQKNTSPRDPFLEGLWGEDTPAQQDTYYSGVGNINQQSSEIDPDFEKAFLEGFMGEDYVKELQASTKNTTQTKQENYSSAANNKNNSVGSDTGKKTVRGEGLHYLPNGGTDSKGNSLPAGSYVRVVNGKEYVVLPNDPRIKERIAAEYKAQKAVLQNNSSTAGANAQSNSQQSQASGNEAEPPKDNRPNNGNIPTDSQTGTQIIPDLSDEECKQFFEFLGAKIKYFDDRIELKNSTNDKTFLTLYKDKDYFYLEGIPVLTQEYVNSFDYADFVKLQKSGQKTESIFKSAPANEIYSPEKDVEAFAAGLGCVVDYDLNSIQLQDAQTGETILALKRDVDYFYDKSGAVYLSDAYYNDFDYMAHIQARYGIDSGAKALTVLRNLGYKVNLWSDRLEITGNGLEFNIYNGTDAGFNVDWKRTLRFADNWQENPIMKQILNPAKTAEIQQEFLDFAERIRAGGELTLAEMEKLYQDYEWVQGIEAVEDALRPLYNNDEFVSLLEQCVDSFDLDIDMPLSGEDILLGVLSTVILGNPIETENKKFNNFLKVLNFGLIITPLGGGRRLLLSLAEKATIKLLPKILNKIRSKFAKNAAQIIQKLSQSDGFRKLQEFRGFQDKMKDFCNAIEGSYVARNEEIPESIALLLKYLKMFTLQK